MLTLKHSDEIAYNGSNNIARMDLYADTAADLTGVTSYDSITLLGGSTALDISTGDLYIMQSGGTWILQPSQGAFSNVYTKAEIDEMIANYYTKTEADEMFEWRTITITTDTLPLTFIADGSPLTAWTISGNGQQQGTPTPDAPITPDFVGTLSDADWTIPITCAGQTTTVYLGEVPTVRRVRKLLLDVNLVVIKGNSNPNDYTYYFLFSTNSLPSAAAGETTETRAIFTHLKQGYYLSETGAVSGNGLIVYLNFGADIMNAQTSGNTVDGLKEYLADQYAAGTPVTVWYVLAEPTTGIVNEPLCKIGDYCDELHSEDAGVAIPTAKGNNVLTIDTTLQPSEITITGKIRET